VVGGSVELMCQVGLLFSGQRPPPGLEGTGISMTTPCDSGIGGSQRPSFLLSTPH
jgi:hypothetical protein